MHPFSQFLEVFVPELERKSTLGLKASWILETVGSSDAADLKAELDAEVRLMFHDPKMYEQLLKWQQDPMDPLLKRQLNILIRSFRQNQIPKELVEKISQGEARLGQEYVNFRADFEGKKVTENDLRELLRKEQSVSRRKKAWEATKQVGAKLAPQILSLVKLRNESAKLLGFENYFSMQLDLQEIDEKWLDQTFEDLAQKAKGAYEVLDKCLEAELAKKFHVAKEELGPWAWSDPFGQEDPLGAGELDEIVQGIDLIASCKDYYRDMGFDVQPILDRSDMYERKGKNQTAFCIHIDRRGDVRTLNNIKPSVQWLETLLHELGHAIYEIGYDASLPWLLREPPHLLSTEAIALIGGRQAYKTDSLLRLVGRKRQDLFQSAENSLKRRQLIFSRWVFVMTAFEKELYRDPDQDLGRLWWELVQKYQNIKAPHNRKGMADWASKYHIALAPVYYYSYLLGEMLASSIQEALSKKTTSGGLCSKEAGQFLQEKLFASGNRLRWDELTEQMIGKPLASDAWLNEFR